GSAGAVPGEGVLEPDDLAAAGPVGAPAGGEVAHELEPAPGLVGGLGGAEPGKVRAVVVDLAQQVPALDQAEADGPRAVHEGVGDELADEELDGVGEGSKAPPGEPSGDLRPHPGDGARPRFQPFPHGDVAFGDAVETDGDDRYVVGGGGRGQGVEEGVAGVVEVVGGPGEPGPELLQPLLDVAVATLQQPVRAQDELRPVLDRHLDRLERLAADPDGHSGRDAEDAAVAV